MSIRVRFAPSPTGYLHIGGARTAIFNWLFAKNKEGKFILRIEDTDLHRSEKKYLDSILDNLKWLRLDWDEIYHQSERLNIYKKYAQKLLEEEKAYLDKGAIIFKVKHKNIEVFDLIHKKIQFDTSLLKDIVLIKSDGYPAYNFACCLDDALMKITHVIRGDDHISNLPKQVLLYDSLGFKLPEFAHIPLIMGEDKKRLSKRHGAVSIQSYKNQGYLSEGLFNYLLLLGWSAGDNKELISKEEAIKLFSLDRVRKTSASFGRKKLDWINKQYIKSYDITALADMIILYLKRKNKKIDNRERLEQMVGVFHNRMCNFEDFINQADFFFQELPDYKEEAVTKFLRGKVKKETFSLLIEELGRIKDFRKDTLEQITRSLIDKLAISGKDLIHPVRVALTGKTVSPGLFETMEALGKEAVVKRLQYAKDNLL
jgi:glutamyl-tRNA synthetase